jgi:hypothetical protein
MIRHFDIATDCFFSDIISPLIFGILPIELDNLL